MKNIRATAGAVAGLMMAGLAGCAGERIGAESPYQEPTPYQQPYRQQEQQGMSGRQKVMLLAGAAALYYMWNKHKDRQGHGPEGQYYRSRNGRIYYRDAQGQAHWVTPPRQPIQVPIDEYERVTGENVNGYDGRVLQNAPRDFGYAY
ncbi:MAG: hypothetical protein ACK47B_19105 [Armatimonadota bacterium]